MHGTIGTMAAAGVLLGLAGSGAAAAGDTDLKLFGYDPAGARAAACFVRVYDDAHLQGHPQQNVTAMSMLVDGQGAGNDRWYELSLAVSFRGLDQQMMANGGCGASFDGQSLISCGIDCDGGMIGIRGRDANSILVDIPDGARTWDPAAEDDENGPADPPEQARFGEDDKTFRLDRAPLSECIPLAYDDELTALLKAR